MITSVAVTRSDPSDYRLASYPGLLRLQYSVAAPAGNEATLVPRPPV